MSWKSVTIDSSITRFGGEGLIHVLEGNYLLQLKKLEPSPEDRDYAGEKGEPQLPFMQFHLQIEDGPDGIGKTLRYTGMLAPAKEDGSGGSWSLGRALHALGADPSKIVGVQYPTYAHFAQHVRMIEAALLKPGKTADGKPLPAGKTGAEVSDNQNFNPRTDKVQVISNITGFFPAGEWALRKQSNSAPHPSTNGSQVPSPAPALSAGPAPTPAAPTPAAPSPEMDMEALVASIMGAAAG
jgi:hypothetical protein